MSLTIYHNPRCSKSRKTLEIIRDAGVTPRVVEYLDEPPAAERIIELAGLIGVPVSALIRHNEACFKDAQDLPDPSDDAALAAWVTHHPRALQRPIVVDDSRKRAIVGRPPENVTDLLCK